MQILQDQLQVILKEEDKMFQIDSHLRLPINKKMEIKNTHSYEKVVIAQQE